MTNFPCADAGLGYDILSNFDSSICCATSAIALSVYKNDSLPLVMESVNSILYQTDDSFVLFVVIDGILSIDLNEFILSLAARPNVVVMRNHANVGLANSMNNVVNFIIHTGFLFLKYFFRMDADDRCFLDRFKKQISYLEEHKLDVLGSACVEIKQNGDLIGLRLMPLTHDLIADVMPRRCAINHPSVLIRFDVFRAGHRYKSNLKNTQDYFLWADLLSAGYVFGNTEEPLIYFRRSSGFYKRRGREKAVNDFKARLYVMGRLRRYTLLNLSIAILMFMVRLMPAGILRFLYFVLMAK